MNVKPFVFFLVFLMACTHNAFAQKSSMLQGKWNVIAVSQVVTTSRDSLYYDLKKDSIYIPAEDLKEARKDGLDSTQTVNLFKSMFESLKESKFVFKKDSVLFESKLTKATGTFQIKGEDTLNMQLKYFQREKEETIYTFYFKGDVLNILLKTDIGYYRFILKK
jgi:hypothetical protein